MIAPRRRLELQIPLPYPKIVALKNIEQFLVPALRIKTSDVKQLLPTTKK